MNDKMNDEFPGELYESPAGWGETEYADYATMQREVHDLHALGEEWERCDIAECNKWTLVEIVGGIPTYKSKQGTEQKFKRIDGLYRPVR